MKAKKSLGQHWLRSESAREAIVGAATLQSSDLVLEVGPGEGFLTEKLLEQAGKVIAVEKDDRLIGVLSEKFEKELEMGKLELIHGDILDFEPSNSDFVAQNYKIVANIPYYITGEIIRKFLTAQNQPSQMVLLVQKEVADRIVAKNGKESLLSISVKAYGEPKYVKTVPRGAFRPAPEVDSAVISINHITKFKIQPETEELFWQIVHQGFAHKRKQLGNNLDCSTETLDACTISPTARAEDLTLDHWLCLTKNWNLK